MSDNPAADFIASLYFAEPQWVQLLWVVGVYVALLAWMERSRGDALGKFVSATLQAGLIASPSAAQRILRIVFLGLFGVSMTIALMRPQWGLETVESRRASAEIMVCLDVSRSMLAEDVAPNRLERAKTELLDLFELIDRDQIGLIAFAGRASVLSPLTPDFGFLRLSLKNAQPASIGRGGTRLEEPIRKAVDGFGGASGVSRSILLITDGEDHDSFPMEAAKLAAERGIRILAIGFGDEAGAQIPLTDSRTGAHTLLKDADGRVVESRLDGDLLREMALVTDGAYIPAGTGLLDLEAIYQQHIAPLTRGQMETQTRTARKDAFQWMVLIGLLCLLGAVLSTSRAARRQNVRYGAASLLLAGALGLALPSPTVVAQSDPPARPTTAEATARQEQDQKDPAQPIPEDPRQAYNLGLEKFRDGRPAAALEYFQAARNRAGSDDELRLRATYNAGWAEVNRADAVREEAPGTALEHLRSAAGWFREAVKLRKGFANARYNLELVLRRAAELADSLTAQDPSDIAKNLEKLIHDQRAFLAALGQTVEIIQHAAQSAHGKDLRQQYQRLGGRELVVLADAEAVSDAAVRESEAIKALSDAERSPEKALRRARLEAALRHLHNAREKMGQTRSRLRKHQGVRAYRRGAAATSALTRARDQFLEPAQRLDSLLTDGNQTASLTAAYTAGQAAAQALTVPTAGAQRAVPGWLTPEFLEQGQHSLGERLNELAQEFEAGLQAMEKQAVAPDPNDAAAPAESRVAEAKRRVLVQRLSQSSPALHEARRTAELALARLREGKFEAALAAQRDSLIALAEAREAFLDLRQLIELVHDEERQAASLLSLAKGIRDQDARQSTAPAQTHWPPEQAFSYANAIHSRNVERAIRLSEMFTEQMTTSEQAQPTNGSPPASGTDQRLERGYEILGQALDDMHKASAVFEAFTDIKPELDAELIDDASDATLAALERLDELRRLFFTLIERLRETARRQQAVNDQTVTLATLTAQDGNESIASRSGPLSHRQSALSQTASTIGQSLEAQAPTADGGSTAKQEEEQRAHQQAQSRVFADAAALVHEGSAAMQRAAEQLRLDPPVFDQARLPQDEALQKLMAALELLQRSQKQQDGDEDQQADQDQAPDQAQSKQQQAGQPESGSRGSMEQLLQGVRDREARRRQEQSAQQTSGGHQPVAKDW